MSKASRKARGHHSGQGSKWLRHKIISYKGREHGVRKCRFLKPGKVVHATQDDTVEHKAAAAATGLLSPGCGSPPLATSHFSLPGLTPPVSQEALEWSRVKINMHRKTKCPYHSVCVWDLYTVKWRYCLTGSSWLHIRFEERERNKSPCSSQRRESWQGNLGRYYGAETMAVRFFPPSSSCLHFVFYPGAE